MYLKINILHEFSVRMQENTQVGFIRIYLNGSFYRVRNPNYTLFNTIGVQFGFHTLYEVSLWAIHG